MSHRQIVFGIVVSIIIFCVVFELVRRKKLKEEYSALWLISSCFMFAFIFKYSLLQKLTSFIGASLPTSTLFLGSIIFLSLVCVQFSIAISKLSIQVKNLAQENALLRWKIDQHQPLSLKEFQQE